MKISHRSWPIRYAYSLESMLRPGEKVSICELFWKMVTTTLQWGAILIVLGLLIYALFVLPFQHQGWTGLLIAPSFIACLWLGEVLIRYLTQRRFADYPHPPGIIRSYIRAKKERWCPIVEVTE